MVLRLFFLLICIYHDNLTQKKTQIKLVRKCLDQGKFEPKFDHIYYLSFSYNASLVPKV